MTVDFDAQTKLSDLRMRVHNKEAITATEYRQIVDDLRLGREVAAVIAKRGAAAKKPKAPAKGPPIDLNTLFGGGPK